MSENQVVKSTEELVDIEDIMDGPKVTMVDDMELRARFAEFLIQMRNQIIIIQAPDGESHLGVLQEIAGQNTLRCVITRNIAGLWNVAADLPVIYEAINYVGVPDDGSIEQYFQAYFGLPVDTEEIWMN